MSEVRFPDLRNEMVRAVKALADPAHQWSAWVRRELPPGGYDEFTHRIHIFYGDTQVLEDPDAAIGIYLRSQEEADALRGLAQALDSLFHECGTELPDEPICGHLVGRQWWRLRTGRCPASTDSA
ncbi:hypothetical protein [Micromonospora sp. BL1]|uniref:SCO4402 family protein n=1 Tax=Micromonospora sp. BL1 TaxID=2478709 RepID=UPI001F486777|nr:hypothetical protein [Micromonospora sp. BL1]